MTATREPAPLQGCMLPLFCWLEHACINYGGHR